MADLQMPRLADVLAARRRIAPHLARTALHAYPQLDAHLGFRGWVKHENHHPVGAFKVRGGVNLLARMPASQREAGVIAASTGNHGQSVAYSARLFGAACTVVVPQAANPAKVAAMEALGARVVAEGDSFDAARRHAAALAEAEGLRYVHSANEPDIIAGVGTLALEMLEDQALDTLIVPVGGGSGAAAACIVAKAVDPAIRVIGVQSAQAPAAYESWRQRRHVEVPSRTWAEGLATGVPFDLTQAILRQHLDDFVLVDDAEIAAAVRLLLEKTGNLAEGAGAAATAAAVKLRPRLEGRCVGLVLSGGNLAPSQLRDILAPGVPVAR
ncbi:MAG TPA: pyridoxal-phosphate dependent enzyme [Candidatus Thermoplasmatota archaeon]|nr:pyridoxal-phosphate dependent enzyme [Candidatus Thermoplasmatota archaeon]